MKREIEIWDYAGDIMKAVKTGVLITTKADDKVNTMTISWGTLGIEWNKPIFTTFIRENRFTREMLNKNPEFTVNIPYGEFNKDILNICGTKTGRDIDKISEMGLTLEESEKVSVPAIRQLPLTLECKVVYKQLQDKNAITEKNNKIFYPQDVDSSASGANKDYHIAYYGQIVSAYIIE